MLTPYPSKPRNARSKRALAKRAPQAIENPKTVLFLRGTTCSQIVQDALNDLYQLRQPLAKKFTKKNPIHPFEDASSLEFFSEKNDASFLVFGSSSKKRPHCVTMIRTFGYKTYDMLELYLDAESYRRLDQFKGKKPAVGLRPMVVFAGTAWESTVDNEYTTAKSLLTDFFAGERGSGADKIDVEGLQYVVVCTAQEETGAVGDAVKPAVHLRVYLIQTKRSGQRLPRVEVRSPLQTLFFLIVSLPFPLLMKKRTQVEEIGPRMSFRLGRLHQPEEAMAKEALKRAKLPSDEKTKKNVSMDVMGDKMGRIHMGRQDLGDLQTRKMKGLKRGRDEEAEAEDSADGGAEVDDDEEGSKRRRK